MIHEKVSMIGNETKNILENKKTFTTKYEREHSLPRIL